MSKKTTTSRFTVMVVHRNGPKKLLRTLAAVDQAIDLNRDKVWLVDNGSTDDSIALVQEHHPHISIIENCGNYGYAQAVNQVVRRAYSRYLLILNNDAFVPEDLLNRFERHFDVDSNIGIIGAQLVGEDGVMQRSHTATPTVSCELGLCRNKLTVLPKSGLVEVPTIVGACMAARREAIDHAGPMDVNFFFFYEDTEWCLRMWQHGWKVMLDLDTLVVHMKGGSVRHMLKESRIEMLRSRFYFYRKMFGTGHAILLEGWGVVRLVIKSLSYLLIIAATLGLNKKAKQKAGINLYLLAWIFLGRPTNWGLQGKVE